MLIRPIREEEKQLYNQVVKHPLQTWEWGEFRKKTGVQVERLGFFDNGKLIKALQVTFHPIPVIGKNAGYFPKGEMPDVEQLAALKQIGERYNALFIKLEPNVSQKVGVPSGHDHIINFLKEHQAVPGRPLFTKYTFQLDLTRPEEELFAHLDAKTRYNINLAHRKGVTIVEDSSAEGIEVYLQILKETTTRQGFYAHGPEYFRQMWQTLAPTGMMKIFHAMYEGTILTTWIMFVFQNVIYYPYGASRSIHRDVMANNLMMWEMIRYGKAEGCHTFDMWGSLGPDPDKKHPWYGFHRFKKGYNGDLVEFLGSFDLVNDQLTYKIFKIADTWRWRLLRIKAYLRH